MSPREGASAGWVRFVPGRGEAPSRPALAFSRYRLILRMTRPARFRFFHGGALMGLIATALGDHPPDELVPVVCEMGRVRFEPGDSYRFGVTLFGEARTLLDRLVGAVRDLGRHRPDPARPLPTLGGNYALESVEELPAPDLRSEMEALQGREALTLQFLSPLRLQRPRELQRHGAAFLDDECFPVEHFLDRLWRRLFRLAVGRYPDSGEREGARPALPVDAASDPSGLLWLDVPIKGKRGADPARPGGKTPGGVLGRVTIRGQLGPWLETLIVGQHAHAGSAVHYALGRYRILEGAPLANDPFRPGRTLLEAMLDQELLTGAASHVVSHTVAAGADGIGPDEYAGDMASRLASLTRQLRRGEYEAAPLLGIISEDRPGKLRPLAIPSVRDRVAQRAACTVLEGPVEALLEDCSYAYRKGFSRSRAAFAIQRAYEEGFRYVLDADISCFFDAVPWDRLFGKLHALFPHEPLVTLLEEWVQAPVLFDGRTLVRNRGLPQGAAVSPMLANLYLDELDEELLGKDYRLVRYADDFVILCKDLEQARGAREDARRAVEALGLDLNVKKTTVASFEQGFSYLGYLFCRSLVIEKKKNRDAQELTADSVPPFSWLAQVPFERIRQVVRPSPGGRAAPAVDIVPLGASGEAATPERLPLYVADTRTTLHLARDTLVVEHPEHETRVIPIRELSHVTFLGRPRATLPLVLRLARLGAPSYFCTATGRLEGALLPPEPDWQCWLAQARLAENKDARLAFARAIVAAKLHNAAALVVRFRFRDATTVAGKLRELERSCLVKTTLDAIRGLEGSGANAFFAALRTNLPPGWLFSGRHKRPPTDPVNAMLSFGYTLLYNHVATALITVGLNPRLGLFHRPRGAFFALAADLQEEYRYLVDALVWAKISRREVKPEQFRRGADPRFPCLLGPELRRRFIEWFEMRLLDTFTPPGAAAPISYRAHMDAQARQLRELAIGRVEGYHPHRVRS